MVILEARDLCHQFPNGRLGIDSINFKINQGELVVICGPNGSGKTVLSRHLNGILLPTRGTVLLEGKPITDDLNLARRKIGLLFQDPGSQIIGETVTVDVSFGPENLRLGQGEIKAAVHSALTAMQLNDKAHMSPFELSGGEKQRLALAGILAMKPRIIIFDEPFSNLDYPGVKAILKQMLKLYQEGHTLLVITHDLEKILAHATRLMILNQGRLVADGQPGDLIMNVEDFHIRRPFGVKRPLETMTWLN